MSSSLPRGGIVGVIGANGAGKTTLFRMIVGQEKPDGGTLTIGETVELGLRRSEPRRSRRRQDGVRGDHAAGATCMMVGQARDDIRAPTWRSFNFKGADQQKQVGDLSGGERNRVHLAKLLTIAAATCCCSTNRPTISTSTRCGRWRRRCINFAGCAVVISHDRWFLDRIATHILAFEGDSEVVWCEGNYQAYAEDLHRRKGTDADQPHRIAYKKLVRA